MEVAGSNPPTAGKLLYLAALSADRGSLLENDVHYYFISLFSALFNY